MERSNQPLTSRRLVVTRAPEQAGELAWALERLGAEVLLMPTVEFAPPEDSSALDAAIARLAKEARVFGRLPSSAAEAAPIHEGLTARPKPCPDANQAVPSERKLRRTKSEAENARANAGTSPNVASPLEQAKSAGFDWILFTSQNAVRFFADRLRANEEATAAVVGLAKLQVAAVGPSTAEAARKEGMRVDYVAKHHTGEALASELASELRGRHVLLPRSDRGDDRLPAALRAAGAEVSEVVAYRTTVPKAVDPRMLERVRGGAVDAIIFASPSAFHNLCGWIPETELAELSRRVQFAAIGPTTAGALRTAGVQVEIAAPEASAAALAEAIVSYYERHPAGVRRA